MKRHRLLGASILFLTVTAAVAPIAYLLGLAHGARATVLVPEPDPAAFADMTDAIWDCEQFGDYDGLRTIDIAIGCGIGMGKLSGAAVPKYGRRLAGGPLKQATFSTIAGKAFVPAAPGPLASITETLGSPLALAMAPGGGGWGPAHAGDPGNLPFVLPSGPSSSPEAPPPPTVPLPGALPMLLAGLAGLRLAMRRKGRPA